MALIDPRAFEEVEKLARGDDPDALVSPERKENLVPGHDVIRARLERQAMTMSSFGSLTIPLTGGRSVTSIVVICRRR